MTRSRFHLGIFCAVLWIQVISTDTATRPYVNDESCPRKPELAINRKCLKKCRTDLDCKGRNRKCLCDDVCGKACVKPSQQCDQLKPLLNGKYQVDMKSNVFGARVKYTCDKFYTLVGLSERICQGDGYWSGKPPRCQEDANQADHAMVPTLGKCHDPPEVLHAHHDGPRSQMIYPVGSQLNYRCEDGYNIDGFFRSMCVGDGRWVGPRMTCSPRRCGHPGDIKNGNREGNTFVYPNRVRYTCFEGYELLGRSFRVCGASGKWSGELPSCIPIKCAKLSSPEHGEMLGTDNTYGATLHFSCQKGYDLKGTRLRRCEHSGKWSGDDVTCQQVDCGQPGPFYNGFLDGGATVYGSEYKFRCFGWTTFEGQSLYTTCLENGMWSHPVPKCWARCTYPTVINGTVLRSDTNDDYGTHGELLNVTCADGHSLNTTEPARCHNGTWTFVPECVPASCSSRPQEIRNGYVRFYTMNHGDKAKYKCNTGYKLQGDLFVTCEFGDWRGKTPECVIDYCRYPGTIDNGIILLVGVIGKYEYRHYVSRIEHNQQIEYHCGPEFRRVGPAAATCVDGEWSPKPLPECVPKQHPKILYLFRGKRSVLPQLGLQFEPSKGSIEGEHWLKWSEDGEVSEVDVTPETADSQKGFCEVPTVAMADISSLPGGYYVPHNSLLTVTCADGYRTSPASGQARCNDGLWTNTLRCYYDDVESPDDQEALLVALGRHGESQADSLDPYPEEISLDDSTEQELMSVGLRHANTHSLNSRS